MSALLTSSSFSVVPYSNKLTGVTRIFVCNEDDRADRIELPADATFDQIQNAKGTFAVANLRTIVLAEVNTSAVGPVSVWRHATEHELRAASVILNVEGPGRGRSTIEELERAVVGADPEGKLFHEMRRMPGLPAATSAAVINVDSGVVTHPLVTPPRAKSAPQPAANSQREGGTYSAENDKRAAADEEAVRRAGFAVARPVYRRGTLVIDVGVENFTKAREEWEAMPLAADACNKLAALVKAEERQDITTEIGSMMMMGNGNLGLNVDREAAKRGEKPGGERVRIEKETLPQIFTRAAVAADVSSPGGAMMSWTSPRLINARGVAFNSITEEAGERHAAEVASILDNARARQIRDPKIPEAPKVVIRTRLDGEKRRAAFAAVSPSYTAVDADKLAEACARVAQGTELRGEVSYDGRRSKIDLLAHTNIRPENAVAGEYFRMGVRLSSDDTGGGAIKVSAVAWRNLCLNLIIIDEGVIKIASLRHIGDPARLKKAVDEALQAALGKIEHFVKAWGIACERKMLDNLRAERGSEKTLKDLLDRASHMHSAAQVRDELLAGTFRGLAEKEILPVPTRKLEDTIGTLIKAHDDNRNRSGARRDFSAHSVTHASLANAISLYAHAYQADSLVEEILEQSAGKVASLKGSLPWAAAN